MPEDMPLIKQLQEGDKSLNWIVAQRDADLAVLQSERAKWAKEVHKPDGFPRVYCLCGSTRFTDTMLIMQWFLTKQGAIVLSWCALPESYFKDGVGKTHIGDVENVKAIVDEVHKRKIDLCDEVMVINVDGYIGESTTSEINYAIAHGKKISWIEPNKIPDKFAALRKQPGLEEKNV